MPDSKPRVDEQQAKEDFLAMNEGLAALRSSEPGLAVNMYESDYGWRCWGHLPGHIHVYLGPFSSPLAALFRLQDYISDCNESEKLMPVSREAKTAATTQISSDASVGKHSRSHGGRFAGHAANPAGRPSIERKGTVGRPPKKKKKASRAEAPDARRGLGGSLAGGFATSQGSSWLQSQSILSKANLKIRSLTHKLQETAQRQADAEAALAQLYQVEKSKTSGVALTRTNVKIGDILGPGYTTRDLKHRAWADVNAVTELMRDRCTDRCSHCKKKHALGKVGSAEACECKVDVAKLSDLATIVCSAIHRQETVMKSRAAQERDKAVEDAVKESIIAPRGCSDHAIDTQLC